MLLLLGPLCLIEGRKVAQLFLPLLVLVLGHGLDAFSSRAVPANKGGGQQGVGGEQGGLGGAGGDQGGGRLETTGEQTSGHQAWARK